MSKLILVCGELATGKTTLAKSISEKLNIPFFYKDVLKEMLADTIGFTNREENKKLSVAVFDIFLNIINNFVACNKDLILESNFKQNEINSIKEIMDKTDYEVICIVLYGDDKILYERYLNRFEKEHRHPAHANFNSELEFNQYNLMLKGVSCFGRIYKYNANTFINPNSIIKNLK